MQQTPLASQTFQIPLSSLCCTPWLSQMQQTPLASQTLQISVNLLHTLTKPNAANPFGKPSVANQGFIKPNDAHLYQAKRCTPFCYAKCCKPLYQAKCCKPLYQAKCCKPLCYVKCCKPLWQAKCCKPLCQVKWCKPLCYAKCNIPFWQAKCCKPFFTGLSQCFTTLSRTKYYKSILCQWKYFLVI